MSRADAPKKSSVIGVGGGVGPMAGVKFHGIIIDNTIATCDNDHLEVHHISRPNAISDRTEYLLGNGAVNPGDQMADSLDAAISSARCVGAERLIFGVTCNTFHAPPIWNEFEERSAVVIERDAGNLDVVLLNMIDETVAMIREVLPSIKCIGLLSTTGTREAGIYTSRIPDDIKVVQVPEEMQDDVHQGIHRVESIYDPTYGIKADSESEKARANFERFVRILVEDEGAEAVILGCTEIPIALPEDELYGAPLINPMTALARAMIRIVDVDKLKPYSIDSASK